MFSDLRAQLEGAGVSVPQKGTLTLYHAGCAAKLRTIETTLEVPGSEEADGKLRVYVATSPKIAEVIPHADGVVAIEVDLDLPPELATSEPFPSAPRSPQDKPASPTPAATATP